MYNSGYTMVNCKKLNLLSQEPQTINGIYAASMRAVFTGKPIVACNCEYGEGVAMTPINVFAIIEAGTIIFTSSILQVRVNDQDSVTIVSLLN